MLRNIALILLGAAGAVAFVLSCGNGNMTEADAQATCDCPAAEAPIVERIRTVEQTLEIAASSQGALVAACDATGGEIALTGRCTGDGVGIPDGVNLLESGAPRGMDLPTGWNCSWNNTRAQPIGVKAIAYCLTPPAASN